MIRYVVFMIAYLLVAFLFGIGTQPNWFEAPGGGWPLWKCLLWPIYMLVG